MTILERIFTDASMPNAIPSLSINFSNALWATNELNQIFRWAGLSLNDVDFIAETDNELIFIECKNSNRIDAVNPDSFKPESPQKLLNVARKYYDSLMFCHFKHIAVSKRKIYCYLLEAPAGSRTLRLGIQNQLMSLLPFKLQDQNNFSAKMIDDIFVLSFAEWNNRYPQFPLKRLVEAICDN